MKGRPVFKKNLAVAVLETLTSLLQVNVAGYEKLTVSVDVTGQALDQFVIKGRNHGNGSLMTLFSAAGDFTSPAGIVVDASGDLTTQAAASSGWVVLDVSGWDKIEVLAASGNVAGSTVSAFVCAN